MVLHRTNRSLLSLVLCLSPLLAFGQSSRGRISGQVIDSSGASIPTAKVTIENLRTHVVRTLQVNNEGSFVAPDIDPGFYSVKAEAPSFKSAVRESIQIEVANDIKVDFQLQPGSVSEVIEVKDEAPLTETSVPC